MSQASQHPPAAFFGMILGLSGLANGWRAAHRVWAAPEIVGQVVAHVALIVWAALVVFYIRKWLMARLAAEAELAHPVQGFFAVLAAVATMICGLAIAPDWPLPGKAMMAVGLAAQLAFAVWAMGGLWQGGRSHETTTPALYLPATGGFLVAAMCLSAFGLPDWASLAFGAGFLSWLVMEGVMLNRLIHQPALPAPMRATIGIHFAPPAVGCVAWLAVTSGAPDMLARIFFGYALFQALVMARLIPWLRQQPFSAAYWAYSFAISALPLAALRLVERGMDGAPAQLAPWLFAIANLLIGGFAIGSLTLLAQGRLVPAAPPRPDPAP